MFCETATGKQCLKVQMMFTVPSMEDLEIGGGVKGGWGAAMSCFDQPHESRSFTQV